MTSTLQHEVTLDYVEQGRRNGVPLILLHGYGDSRRSFDRVLPRLPASIYAIAVSQRGHGDSDRPAGGYSVDDFAADVANLMDRLDLPAAVIAGHSMGASVAQRFALLYPNRVLGLVLIGSFFTLKNHAGIEELWNSMVSLMEDPIDLNVVRSFQSSVVSDSFPRDFLEAMIRESMKVPARVWKEVLAALRRTDFTRELGNIRVPPSCSGAIGMGSRAEANRIACLQPFRVCV